MSGEKGGCSSYPTGAQTAQPCPTGHYCPGGNETHLGAPKACPKHTYLAEEGGQSLAECRPCPAGYHCPRPGESPHAGWMQTAGKSSERRLRETPSLPGASTPGLSSFEDHPCPPGHWCPGAQGALLCPPGTFRTEPGASAPKDCKLCPPGYYCPDSELRGHANVFPTPCQAGSECPAGEPEGPPPCMAVPTCCFLISGVLGPLSQPRSHTWGMHSCLLALVLPPRAQVAHPVTGQSRHHLHVPRTNIPSGLLLLCESVS